MRKRTDSSKPRKLFLRSTSAVSLNERFSQVLMDQVTQSRIVTFDPTLLRHQRTVSGTPPAVNKEPSSLWGLQVRELVTGVSPRVKQHLRRRRNVWTRLGWRRLTCCLSTSKARGFWSFRNKYRWRARFTSTYRRQGIPRSQLGQRHLLSRSNIQKLAAGRHLRLHLQRGGASASHTMTKKRLDAQLDEYMSLSKSRLDQQLDDYMSMSRQRLDAELDEYMSMAGETELQWN
ncbi:uncharacterized protein LOC113169845 [Anabas testudineus]|uniref:uncharacterized protein LOC113169845 n=1 Tax=Anabas testudineus TaxID=64144 RepID=UPI000E45D990|nr:uncharacterized protein LOC113169845 [Anabas testudineus]